MTDTPKTSRTPRMEEACKNNSMYDTGRRIEIQLADMTADRDACRKELDELKQSVTGLCEMVAAIPGSVVDAAVQIGKLTKERDEAVAVLRLIADHGGTTTDEGCACSGTGCAEQALTFLDASTPLGAAGGH